MLVLLMSSYCNLQLSLERFAAECEADLRRLSTSRFKVHGPLSDKGGVRTGTRGLTQEAGETRDSKIETDLLNRGPTMTQPPLKGQTPDNPR